MVHLRGHRLWQRPSFETIKLAPWLKKLGADEETLVPVTSILKEADT